MEKNVSDCRANMCNKKSGMGPTQVKSYNTNKASIALYIYKIKTFLAFLTLRTHRDNIHYALKGKSRTDAGIREELSPAESSSGRSGPKVRPGASGAMPRVRLR